MKKKGIDYPFDCSKCTHTIIKLKLFTPSHHFEPQLQSYLLNDRVENLIKKDTKGHDFIECPKCQAPNWILPLRYYNPPCFIRIRSFRDLHAKEELANILWWEFKRRNPDYREEYNEKILPILTEFKRGLPEKEKERLTKKFQDEEKQLAKKYELASAVNPIWRDTKDIGLLRVDKPSVFISTNLLAIPPGHLKRVVKRFPLKEWLKYLMIWEMAQRYHKGERLTWEDVAKNVGESLADVESKYEEDRRRRRIISNTKKAYGRAYELVMGESLPPREKSTSGYLRETLLSPKPPEVEKKKDWLALIAADEKYKALKRREHREDEAEVYNDKLVAEEIHSLLKAGFKAHEICTTLGITIEKYKKCRWLRVAHDPPSIAPTQPPSEPLPDKRDHPEIQLAQLPLSTRDRPFAEFWRVRRKLFPITQGINTYHLTNKFPDRQDKSAGCKHCAKGFSSYAIFLYMRKRGNLYLIDFLNPRYINKGTHKDIESDEQGEGKMRARLASQLSKTYFTQIRPSQIPVISSR